VGIWTRHEINDLGAHENPCHAAIATRPANASDIRYAVMRASRDHSFFRCEEQSDEAIQRQAGLWIASRSRVHSCDPLARNDDLNMRHDRLSSDHFRREPYPSRRDPQRDRCGGAARGRGLQATPRAGAFARAG